MRAKPTVERKPASARSAANTTTDMPASTMTPMMPSSATMPATQPAAAGASCEPVLPPSTWSITKASGQGSATRISVLSSRAVREPASSGPWPFMKGRKRFSTRRMGWREAALLSWGTAMTG